MSPLSATSQVGIVSTHHTHHRGGGPTALVVWFPKLAAAGGGAPPVKDEGSRSPQPLYSKCRKITSLLNEVHFARPQPRALRTPKSKKIGGAGSPLHCNPEQRHSPVHLLLYYRRQVRVPPLPRRVGHLNECLQAGFSTRMWMPVCSCSARQEVRRRGTPKRHGSASPSNDTTISGVRERFEPLCSARSCSVANGACVCLSLPPQKLARAANTPHWDRSSSFNIPIQAVTSTSLGRRGCVAASLSLAASARATTAPPDHGDLGWRRDAVQRELYAPACASARMQAARGGGGEQVRESCSDERPLRHQTSK